MLPSFRLFLTVLILAGNRQVRVARINPPPAPEVSVTQLAPSIDRQKVPTATFRCFTGNLLAALRSQSSKDGGPRNNGTIS